MILPSHLAPLPVFTSEESSPSASRAWNEDFVSAGDVVKVLLGTSGSLPVEGLPAEDFDSFAGRADVFYDRPPVSPFRSLAEEAPRILILSDQAPPARVKRNLLHPAFEAASTAPTPAVAGVKRAAAPIVAIAAAGDAEDSFGAPPQSGGDRWWLFGLGVAIVAIVFSGTFVDFTSREAAKRADLDLERMSASSRVAAVETPAPLAPEPATATATGSLASAQSSTR